MSGTTSQQELNPMRHGLKRAPVRAKARELGMKQSIYRAMPQLGLVLILAALCAALDGYSSLMMMHSVDAVMGKDRAVFSRDVVKLLAAAFAMIPATILLAYARGLFKRKAIVSAKINYIRRIFQKNINEFQRENTSKYVSALTNDVNTIENNYIDGLYGILVSGANFLAAVIVIGFASPLALGFGLVVGAVSALISVKMNKPIVKHQMQRSTLYEGYTGYLKEVLGAFHIIKMSNLGGKAQKDFGDKSAVIQQKGYLIDRVSTYVFALQHLVGNGSFILLLGIICFLAIKGNLSLGGAVLVVTNMDKMMQPLFEAGEWLPKMLAVKPLFQKIDATMLNKFSEEETLELAALTEGIEFDRVSFSYEETVVLKEVSFKIQKGGKYLVIGPSGGGKSTLLKLLRKYHQPGEGEIRIDGAPLREVTKDSYYHHISNIEQQVFLFEDTVRNNICLYKPYSEEEILRVVRQAGLEDFVKGLPEGLDSMIYDNGRNVSGGEKSRLAIARGLLQRADILFLDEAFASLDPGIAREIEQTILGLDGVTVVNVSHVVFEQTKSKYDDIFVVKNKAVQLQSAAIA